MPSLKIINTIIRAIYYDQLAWKKLSDGFVASTHIPLSHYKDIEIVHSVNILQQFLKNPALENKFRISRALGIKGQIINLSAHASTSEHMRQNTVTGLPGIMIKEHSQLANALINTRSHSESYLHIEFPDLSKVKNTVNPAFMDTIQSLVHDACWFRLSLDPTVHIRDINCHAGLVGDQMNNLGGFNPVRADYAPTITSVTREPLENVTPKVLRATTGTEVKENKSIILHPNIKPGAAYKS